MLTRLNPTEYRWRDEAGCLGLDRDRLFFPVDIPTDGHTEAVAPICSACPVRAECLAEAIEHDYEFGIWAGMSRPQRMTFLARVARQYHVNKRGAVQLLREEGWPTLRERVTPAERARRRRAAMTPDERAAFQAAERERARAARARAREARP